MMRSFNTASPFVVFVAFLVGALVSVSVRGAGDHFNDIDYNGDGYLDVEEVADYFGGRDMSDFWGVEDADRDGRVSREEYFGPKDEL